MRRYATLIFGGLLGLATGILVANPFAAVFGPTSVSWDATACSAGVYTITTTATDSDGRTYVSTSRNVRMPRKEFVQELDLPAGSFTVSTLAEGSAGQFFRSIQTITSRGAQAFYGTGGRTRPPGTQATGRAGSRVPKVTDPPRDYPRSTTSASPPVSVQASPTLPPRLQRLLALLAEGAGPADEDRLWERIQAVDTDNDGEVDTFRVDLRSGEIIVWRIVR